MIKRASILLAGLLLATGISFGQASLADDMFNNFEFEQAIKFYESDESALSNEQWAKLAFSYYSINDFSTAEQLYAKVVEMPYMLKRNNLYYAVCLKNNGKFEKAKEQLEVYRAIDSTDHLVKETERSIQFLEAKKEDELEYEVVNLRDVNSGAGQFSPVFYKEGILFAGEVDQDAKRRPHIEFRNDFQDSSALDYGMNDRPLVELMYAPVENGEVGQAEPFRWSEKFHFGSFALDPVNNEIIFTKMDLSHSWNANLRRHPRLFHLPIDGETKVKKAEHLKMKKLHNEWGSGHPALTSDGKVMIFSSDMPDGHGGSDLYYSVRNDDGSWGEPVNLGPEVNTEGDELFPVIFNDSRLYFATNGRPGFGGLDIFKADLRDGKSVSNIKILDEPFNSSADDYGIALDPENEKFGFITSNRFGGRGDDDLFMFREVLNTYVKGQVLTYDGDPAVDVLVAVYDEDGNLVGQTRTDQNGNYQIPLEEGKKYTVIATTKGFAAEENIETDENWNSNEALDMKLTPSETVQGVVTDENGNPAAGVDIKLFDDDGMLVYWGKTDEDGRYQFALEQDSEYDVIAEKDGYRGDAHIVTDSDYDSQDDTNIQLLRVEEMYGIVRDENGDPVENALVKLLDENGQEIAQVRTDENGMYQFDDLVVGKDYRLEASITGFGARETVHVGEDWDSESPVDLTLVPMNTAQGMVKDQDGNPASNTWITVTDEDGNVLIKTRTDEDGRYQVVLDENKEYDFLAEKGNLEGTAHVKTDDSYDTNTETDIILGPKRTIQGIVRDENGNPVAGATVNLYDEDGNLIASTTTDENGYYKFAANDDTNYQIIAKTDGFEGVENVYTGENWDDDKLLDITLEPVGKPTTGLVADSRNNEPIDKVKVTLIDTDTGKKTVTYTDEEGIFDLRLSENTNYTLRLEKDGYFPKSVDIPTGGQLPENIDLNKKHDLNMDYAGYKVKPIYFDYNKYTITAESKEGLMNLVNMLKDHPEVSVEVKAYADCRGSVAYNKVLTNRRANSVKQFLVSKGVSASQITTQGMGKGDYVNNCYEPDMCSEEEHGQNRRADFNVNMPEGM